MKKKHKPLFENLVVSVPRTEKKSEGGIIINVTEREKDAAEEGTVLALGPLAFEELPDSHKPKVGDKVSFARYGGKFLYSETDDSADIKVFNEKHILAIIEE